jgi:hypothetical protein
MGSKIVKILLLMVLPLYGYSQIGVMQADTSLNVTIGASRIKYKTWPYTLNALQTKVPSARTITVNGVTQDLSVNRTWTVATTAPDSTVFRTVLNSFTKAQTNTQIANAVALYLPLTGGNITGSLGIGTATPSAPLEVVGNAKINGTVTASPAQSTLQLATLGQVGLSTIKIANGTGAATQIVIPHGFSGVSSTSMVLVQARNAPSAGIQYVTIDATNIYINYSVAPVTGTNNLSYSIYVKP